MRQRRRPRHELTDHGAAAPHLAGQRAMLARIHEVDAAPEHADRGAVGLEGSAVRRGIDSAGQAADHYDAARGEIGGEPLGHRKRVRRAGA